MKAATRCRAGSGGLHAISIHAAREGGDGRDVREIPAKGISIHAAREGGDAPKTAATGKREHFNPRRP